MVPRASPWAARISPDGTLFVQGPELSTATVTDAWFIPDQPDQIQDDAAQPLSVRAGGFTLALKPAKGFDPAQICPACCRCATGPACRRMWSSALRLARRLHRRCHRWARSWSSPSWAA